MNDVVIYDFRSLIDYIKNGYKPEFLFFWGHHTRTDRQIGKQCLSQWWPCSFTIDKITYNNAEQFLMAEKARFFGDQGALSQILRAKDPAEAKNLGRKVKGFEDDAWEKKRVVFALQANEAKFRQNQDLRDYLLGTGQKILVETSPVDTVWGIGLVENDPRASDPEQWRGLNLLGFVLMNARSRLRASF